MNPSRKTTITLGALALTAAVGLPAPGAVRAQDSETKIDGARAALEQWVELRRVISKERGEWALGRELLGERIALAEREIAALRANVGEAEASIAEADKRRAELLAENERLTQASASLLDLAAGLEQRTKHLLQRLPDPLRERVKPLSQLLPEDSAATKVSISVRFRNVIGILNEVNKFNREISVASEVRALTGGVSAEVTTMYIGIAQAYYGGANGGAAGVGSPSAEGWTWVSDNQAAADIAKAIAIHANEQVAAFVPLPLRVQ